MSGASGHLMHLHDDLNLTFGELHNVLTDFADGKLSGAVEKFDGKNIVFTWNVKLGQLRMARSTGDITRGGLDAEALAQKFQGRDSLIASFKGAFDALTSGLQAQRPSALMEIFGSDGRRWFSAEVVLADDPNVVKYDTNALILHEFPIFERQSDGALTRFNTPPGNYFSALVRSAAALSHSSSRLGWAILPPVPARLTPLSDRAHLDRALWRLDSLQIERGLTDQSTLRDYVSAELEIQLKRKGFAGWLLESTCARILRLPGALDLRALKNSSPLMAPRIDEVVKGGDALITDILEPIDRLIGDLGAAVFGSMTSALIRDGNAEATRTLAAWDAALQKLRASDDKDTVAFVEKQVGRISKPESVRLAIEGVVFHHQGRPYKLTGAFAAFNQVLGLLKYDKPVKPST